MLFKNHSSLECSSSSVRCQDFTMSRPPTEVKLRSVISTPSILLVGGIDPDITKHTERHPIYNMEEIPSTVGGRRRFSDELLSGSLISGNSKRAESIFICENENDIRSHYCPLDPELDGRDWNEGYQDHFDFTVEKYNYCSVLSDDYALHFASNDSSSESDEENVGSDVGYAPLESEDSTKRNSTISLTSIEYAPLENEPSTNKNSPAFPRNLMSHFVQLTNATSPSARLEKSTMEAWLNDSSDEFDDPSMTLLEDVKSTLEDESDMEEFENDSDSQNQNENLKSPEEIERKDECDKDEDNKDFLSDSKYSENNVENESSTKSPSKQSKLEHSENENTSKFKQSLNTQHENQNEEKYSENNKDKNVNGEGNENLSTDTNSTENNADNESSTELSKIEHSGSENKQPLILNTRDEIQNEKEYLKNNSENDSTAFDLLYPDDAERNDIESNMNIQDEYKNNREVEKSQNTDKNEQPANVNEVDENQNEGRHAEKYLEADSIAIDMHYLDNGDTNGVKLKLNKQDGNIEKNQLENDLENYDFAEDPTFPQLYYISGSVSNLSTHFMPKLKFRDRLQTLLQDENEEKPGKDSKNDFTTDVITLQDFANKNETVSNLNPQDENKNKKEDFTNSSKNYVISEGTLFPDCDSINEPFSNVCTQDKNKDESTESESDLKDDYIFEVTTLQDFVSLNRPASNFNTKDEKDYNKAKVKNDLMDDYIFDIITFPDYVSLNGSVSSLSSQDENEDKKEETKSDSKSYVISDDILSPKCKRINEPASNLITQNDNKDKKEHFESDMKTDCILKDIDSGDFDSVNAPVSNLNIQDENKVKKEHPENNLVAVSTETKLLISNLTSQDENKDKKEHSESEMSTDYISKDINWADFDSANASVSNLDIQEKNKIKKEHPDNNLEADITEKYLPVSNLTTRDENKDIKEHSESDMNTDYISKDINWVDFDDVNALVSNLIIHVENKLKKEHSENNLEAHSTKKYLPVSNLISQDENKGKKEHSESEMNTDDISKDIDWADFDSVNAQLSNLNIQGENTVKKEYPENNLETHSTEKYLPVSNITSQDENKDKKEHSESEMSTDYISKDWADFDSANSLVSNFNIQEENKVKREYSECNLEAGCLEKYLHCAVHEQKEKYKSEIEDSSNKIDANRNEAWYHFFPKSQPKETMKSKSKENMATLTLGPYGITISKSKKKDETQPDPSVKRFPRSKSEIFSTKDKNKLHIEPSTTTGALCEMPLLEEGNTSDANDGLVLYDLTVHDTGCFQPALTDEQRVASRQPNKLTKFFQSLKKKLERNKKS